MRFGFEGPTFARRAYAQPLGCIPGLALVRPFPAFKRKATLPEAASEWRLELLAFMADTVEAVRLGLTPLVNAWNPQVKGNVDAAAADDDDKGAAYLVSCVQVCNDASLFITSSLRTIIIIIVIIIIVVVVVVVVIIFVNEERGSPCRNFAASNARAVLKLRVTGSGGGQCG